MIQLLFMRRRQLAVPLNVVRRGVQSDFYIGLPRFLKMGELRNVIKGCTECGERRGVAIAGSTIQGFTADNKTAPRLVIKLSVWRCQEAALKSDLLSVLPPLLRAPVIPVERHY